MTTLDQLPDKASQLISVIEEIAPSENPSRVLKPGTNFKSL